MKLIFKSFLAISILSFYFSCDPGGSVSDTGFLELSITDAPIDAGNVKSLWIKIIEIEYQYQDKWHSTGLLSSPLNVDLLTLTHGKTEDFSAIPLVVGSYSNIRFILDIADESAGNSGCYIEFNDGSTSPLFVPSGEQSGYKANGTFDITKDGVTGITVDFDLRKMVKRQGNGTYFLHPALRMVNNGNVGTITVPVDEGSGYNNIVVYAYIDGEYVALEAAAPVDGEVRFPNSVNSINADIDGNYILPFLPAGIYDLVIVGYNDENFIEVIRIVEDVVVTASGNTTDNSTLPLSDISYKDMVYVPGGDFIQKEISASGFTHTISPFQIAKYEVTYELWYEVYQWAGQNDYTFGAPWGTEGDSGVQNSAPTEKRYEPVTTNWRNTILWCNAYSEIMGFDPVYRHADGLIIKSSTWGDAAIAVDAAVPDWNANGFRLPTEGEWQYAASYIDGINWTPENYASGDSAPWDTSLTVEDFGWYQPNSLDLGINDPDYGTNRVGMKNPNQLGIYDMSGNVSEYCWDWSYNYPIAPQVNYRGPDTGGYRVLKGMSWRDGVMRIGDRVIISPDGGSSYLGFRIARNP